jgi:hypothetical protein
LMFPTKTQSTQRNVYSINENEKKPCCFPQRHKAHKEMYTA